MSQKLVEIIAKQIELNRLPKPETELKFDSKRKWRFDFAWPDIKLAFEIEGGAFVRGRHVRPKGFADDVCKYNAATLAGWAVLRATGEQVRQGKAITWLIEAISSG